MESLIFLDTITMMVMNYMTLKHCSNFNQCAECGSNKIIVEYSPGLYFHFDGDDKCKQLTYDKW